MKTRKRSFNRLLSAYLISFISLIISTTTVSACPSDKLPHINAFKPILYDLQKRFPKESKTTFVVIATREQKLYLIEDLKVTESYSISTAEAGVGNTDGSNKTPLGVHKVSEKVGKDATLGRVFIGRKKTQKIAKILKNNKLKSKDENITSRIFRLSGMEKGINTGRNVDTFSRLIYIHGTDEEGRLGKPVSKGSIRMANKDIIDLFDRIPVGTIVNIIR